MICESQNARCVRAGLAVISIGALAGTAWAQSETRDWLLPKSGLWSDAANWSGGNVPDTPTEIARLSPGAAVPPGLVVTPIATVDGVFMVQQLQGNGSVGVLIDEGAQLEVTDGITDGLDGGTLVVTLGSGKAGGLLSSIVTIGNGAGRQAALRNTTFHMIGEGDNVSIIRGGGTLSSSSRIQGQGTIEGITNYGEIVAIKEGQGSGELRFTNGLINRGSVTVESTGHLVFDHCSFAQVGDLVNNSLITVLDGTVSGSIVGRIDWIGECSVSNSEFLSGTSFVEGVLNVIPMSNYFAGHRFFLFNGAQLRCSDTVFLQGNTSINGIKREIVFEPSATPPRLSVPQGETIVAMPGFKITGSGIIDANFVNYGELKINRGTSFDPLLETLEVRGEFVQTADAKLGIVIDKDNENLIVDRLVVTGGDAELDGALDVTVLINLFTNDPLNQIALANRTVTVVSLDDHSGLYALSGAFSDVEVQLLDDRVSRIPDVIYLPDRVDLRFYCRADVNRNGTVEPADFTAWLSAYQQGSPLADMNGNSVLSTSDFTKWVDLYNRGCPE